MSAGICIMNKNSIALAADSAVTIGPHLAVRNSANKLFALSNSKPIGMIIYANAEFMEIPFEIIAKEYKAYLADKSFDTMTDYVISFLDYLISNCEYYHFDKNEEKYVSFVVTDFLQGLDGDYRKIITEKIETLQRELTESELQEAQNEAVALSCNFVDDMKPLDSSNFSNYVNDTYSKLIENTITNFFDWIDTKQLCMLKEKIVNLFDKEFFRNCYTGIAFAGYGDKEVFPEMHHVHLSGMLNKEVRFAIQEIASITEDCTATITPLAQTDVMQTFLFGINDELLDEIANEIPKQINDSFNKIDDDLFAENKKDDVRKTVSTDADNVVRTIINSAHQRFLQPIIASVTNLPLDELSQLAESMINITSLRRKVALDSNIDTVGGPIDVATINKNDGFIWIKRKYYFDKTINPQYTYSHYNHASKEVGEFNE